MLIYTRGQKCWENCHYILDTCTSPQRYGIVAQHQIECRKEYDFPRLILYVVRAEMIIRIVNLDLKCQNSSFYFVFIKIFEAFPLK